MSSSKDTQEKISISLISHSMSRKVNAPSIYPSPPNSPPQKKSDISQARREFEDELPSLEIVSSISLTSSTSPSRNESDLTSEAEKDAESRKQKKVSSLKTELGLVVWQCGCLTLKNTPCSRQIQEKNKDQIDSLVESMISLIRSSPELESKLGELVMLVHCHQHDCGIPKESRIDTWTAGFPDGEGDAKHVVSAEKQIKKALGQVSAKCIGLTQKSKRCTVGIGGQKVQHCFKTIDEIVKSEVYLDDATLDRFLKVLETYMYCHIHINRQPLKKVAVWKLSIVEIREKTGSKVQSIEVNTPGGYKPQFRAPETPGIERTSTEISNNLVLQNQELTNPKYSRLLSPEVDRNPAAFWPEAFDTTPFEIIARSNRLADYKSSYHLVQNEIMRSLQPKDLKDGFVYLYEVEGNSGFVKVGYTGRTPKKRHEEWGFDCNRVTKALYPITTGSATVVPNARRVEALCHAELDHRRIRIYCKGCLKPHIEWFETSPAEAIAVIRKWSKWMTTRPYQSIQLESGVEWTLKEEEMQKVCNMDQFMKKVSLHTQ